MFGRHDSSSNASGAQPSLRMTVMPEEFYGGKDPVLHYDEQAIELGTQSKPVTLSHTSATPRAGVQNGAGPKSRVIPITIASLAFLAAVGGITWYYLTEPFRQNQTEQEEPVSPVVDTQEEPNTNVPVEIPTSTAVITTSTIEEPLASSTVSLAPAPLDFPRKIFTDSADLDADAVTDVEEELFAIDSGVYDTDEDGYYDGLEIVNLYSPRGVAPEKLVDSGLISDYTNPTWQYRVYFPIAWEVAPVDINSDQVLFSAITSDYIEIRAVKKNVGETFIDWFARVATGEVFTDLTSFKNRFGIDGWRRDDNAVAYFESGNTVFVLMYHSTGGSGAASFRQTFRMMSQSFRPTRVFTDIPDQTPLPQEPSGNAPLL